MEQCRCRFVGVDLSDFNLRSDTVAQVSRLFACLLDFIEPDDFIVTGDGDMLMMKDIFEDRPQITSYGHDLTGRSEVPMCYVAGTKDHWRMLMQLDSPEPTIEGNIVQSVPNEAYSDKWEDYWSVDQKLLTRMCAGYSEMKYVDRHMDRGLAYGRKDRYDWNRKIPEIIDVHMLRGIGYWTEIVQVTHDLFGDNLEIDFEIIKEACYGR